jgi:hypothetical protein
VGSLAGTITESPPFIPGVARGATQVPVPPEVQSEVPQPDRAISTGVTNGPNVPYIWYPLPGQPMPPGAHKYYDSINYATGPSLPYPFEPGPWGKQPSDIAELERLLAPGADFMPDLPPEAGTSGRGLFMDVGGTADFRHSRINVFKRNGTGTHQWYELAPAYDDVPEVPDESVVVAPEDPVPVEAPSLVSPDQISGLTDGPAPYPRRDYIDPVESPIPHKRYPTTPNAPAPTVVSIERVHYGPPEPGGFWQRVVKYSDGSMELYPDDQPASYYQPPPKSEVPPDLHNVDNIDASSDTWWWRFRHGNNNWRDPGDL